MVLSMFQIVSWGLLGLSQNSCEQEPNMSPESRLHMMKHQLEAQKGRNTSNIHSYYEQMDKACFWIVPSFQINVIFSSNPLAEDEPFYFDL